MLMKKQIVLPDNTRVRLKRAEIEDVDGILKLYDVVYSSKYTLPEATRKDAAIDKINSSGCRWYICVKKNEVIGSVIFLIDEPNRLGKIYAAAVRPDYQGKNIMHYMVKEIMEDLCNVSKFCDAVYATTRTVSFASQIVLEHAGFVSLGIFPNVRRVQKHESHGLEVFYSKTAFENRLQMPTLIPELKKLYSIAQDIFKFEDALIVDKLDDVPQEDSIWFDFEDNAAEVESIYNHRLTSDRRRMAGFFPFHTPNMRFYSKDLKNEIYCNINRQDGHMAIIAYKCEARNFTNLLNSFCRAAQAVAGAEYVELMVSAFDPVMQKQALEARFLPCSYFPAMRMNFNGERTDYMAMSRSFVALDFTEIHLVKNNQKFLEAFMECWYSLILKFNKPFEEEPGIFQD
ncbi:MAG TPA: hypothetical protein DC017_04905 [Candidatus Wallbacteria bacterium]|nr:hypothetical protein [Candidatus Wallbacteria bacterium]